MRLLLRRAASREWNQPERERGGGETEGGAEGGEGERKRELLQDLVFVLLDFGLALVHQFLTKLLPFHCGTMSILCHCRLEVCNLPFHFIRVTVKRLP